MQLAVAVICYVVVWLAHAFLGGESWLRFPPL